MIKIILLYLTVFPLMGIELMGDLVLVNYRFKQADYAPGVFVQLMAWKTSEKENCLLYRTPLKSKKGALYIIPSVKCDLKKLKPKHRYASKIDKLSFSKNDKTYVYSYNNKKLSLSFPMTYKFSSLKLAVHKKNLIHDGRICRQSSIRCDSFNIDRCDHCESQHWSPFLNWKCGHHSLRICGQVFCGRKNERACLKGLSQKEGLLSCDQAKELSYCQKGLQIICEGDGKVSCR